MHLKHAILFSMSISANIQYVSGNGVLLLVGRACHAPAQRESQKTGLAGACLGVKLTVSPSGNFLKQFGIANRLQDSTMRALVYADQVGTGPTMSRPLAILRNRPLLGRAKKLSLDRIVARSPAKQFQCEHGPAGGWSITP